MKDRIKAIRKYKNMKQAEFAQVLGIKPNTVTSYETGLRVPSEVLYLCLYYSTQKFKIKRFYKIYSRICNGNYWIL